MKWLTRTILLILILTFTQALVSAQETITYGDTVEGTLEQGERSSYTFEAKEGDVLVISLRSTSFDPIVYLLDANGNELKRDDDSGGEFNSLISGFSVPVTGTYTIQAASFSDSASGQFTLSLDSIEPQIIEYGQTIQLEPEAASSVATFTASEGDAIVVTLETTADYSNMGIEMNVPEGTIEYGSYISDQLHRLGPYTVQQTGTYVLNVRSSEAAEITLRRLETVPLVIGDATTATFDDAQQQIYFRLDVDVPTVVDIMVDSQNRLDTKLELISPYGYSEEFSDDTESSVDPGFSSKLLSTVGTYYLVLDAANPNATLSGDVAVSIIESELPSLEDEPVEMAFDYNNNERVFQFEAEAGESFLLTVDIESTDTWASPTVEFSQEGTVFANFNSNGITGYTFNVTVPEDGTVNVIFRAYDEVTVTAALGRSLE